MYKIKTKTSDSFVLVCVLIAEDIDFCVCTDESEEQVELIFEDEDYHAFALTAQAAVESGELMRELLMADEEDEDGGEEPEVGSDN